jgi:autotransporter translocation and assembly factor TamB
MARRGALRRVARYGAAALGSLVLLLVLLALGALWYLRSDSGRQWLQHTVVELLREQMPGFDLASIEGDYLHTITLRNITLRDRHGGEAIRVAKVALRYQLGGLLRREVRIAQLMIDQPRVVLRMVGDDALNLSELIAPPKGAEPKATDEPSERFGWKVTLEELKISGGAVIDRRAAKAVRVRKLDLALAAKLEPNDVSVALHSLSAQTRVAGQPETKLELDAQLKLMHWQDLDRIRVKPSQIRLTALGLPSGRAAIDISLAGPFEAIAIETKAQLGQAGQLELTARGSLLAPQPRYELSLALEQLRPDRLIATLPPLQITGALVGRGEGIPLQPDSVAALELGLQKSEAAGIAIDRLDLQASTRGASWVVDRLALRRPGVRVDASGAGTLEELQAQLALKATNLSKLPLPLDASAGTAPQLSSGSIALRTTIEGRFDGALNAQANGAIDALRIGEAQLEHLELSGNISGLPKRPTGTVELHLREGRWPDPPLRVRTLDAKISGSPRRGEAEIAMRALAGTARTTLRWNDRATIRAELAAQMRGLRLLQLPPISGDLQAKATRRQGIVSLDARVGGRASRVEAHASVPIHFPPGALAPLLSTRRSGNVRIKASNVDLRLLEQLGMTNEGQLGGRLDLVAQADGPWRNPKLQARVDLRGGHVAELEKLAATVSVDLSDSARLEAHASQADERLLRLSAESALSTRELPRLSQQPLSRLAQIPLRLTLRTAKLDLSQLARIEPTLRRLGGHVQADVAIDGTLVRPHGKLTLSVANGRFGRRELGAAKLALAFEGSESSPYGGKLELELDGRRVLSGRGSLAQSLAAIVRSPEGLAAAPLTGQIELHPIPVARLRRLDDTLSHFEQGTLSARALVRGTPARPKLEFEATLDNARVSDGAIGTLEVQAKGTLAGLDARARLRQPGGGQLTARAELKLGQPGNTISAKLRSSNFDIAFASAFAPGLERLAGKLSLNATARGPLSAPALEAKLQLSKGRVRPSGMSELSRISLRAALDSREARIEQLSVGSGAGHLRAAGRVKLSEFSPQAFSLRARAEQFRIGVPPITDAVFDGRVRIDGKREGSTLRAKLQLVEGAINIPEIAIQPGLRATGSLSDVVFVDRQVPRARAEAKPGAAPSQTTPTRVELATRARSLMVRGKQFDVEIGLELRVELAPGEAPRIVGVVRIRRGRIELLGNRYTVERAVVRLSGQKEPDPELDIRLSRSFPEGTVYIKLQGPLSDSELSLSSEPSNYDQAQLLSLVLTGRLDQSSEKQSGNDRTWLASAVAQAIVGMLAQQVASQVGIDVTRVGISEAQDQKSGESRLRAEAEIGKYVTRRLYVAYRRVFGADEDENANEAISEYRISSRWLLMALFGDRAVGNLDLVWTYRY